MTVARIHTDIDIVSYVLIVSITIVVVTLLADMDSSCTVDCKCGD